MTALWASTKTHFYAVETSTCSMARRIFKFSEDEQDERFVLDHIYSTRLVDNATLRPLHDLIMATEATRMA